MKSRMGFTWADYRRQRMRRLDDSRREREKVRRPTLSRQEERFLYSLHLKTIEYRTLMATLKAHLTPSEYDELVVDYSIRLRKAKKNFEANNWKPEIEEEVE